MWRIVVHCSLVKDPRGGLLIQGSVLTAPSGSIWHLDTASGKVSFVSWGFSPAPSADGTRLAAVRHVYPGGFAVDRLTLGVLGRSRSMRPVSGSGVGGPHRALALTVGWRRSAGSTRTAAGRTGRTAVAGDVAARPRVAGRQHGMVERRRPLRPCKARSRRQRQAPPLRLRRRPTHPLCDGHLRLRARAGPDKPARAGADKLGRHVIGPWCSRSPSASPLSWCPWRLVRRWPERARAR